MEQNNAYEEWYGTYSARLKELAEELPESTNQERLAKLLDKEEAKKTFEESSWGPNEAAEAVFDVARTEND
jgi:hypothetical protein